MAYSLTLRSSTTSPLTNTQMDSNFLYLKDLADAAQATGNSNASNISTLQGTVANHTAQIANLESGGADLSQYALLNSPHFTGIPTAPTATVGTNTTQLATCEFVMANPGTPAPIEVVDVIPISSASFATNSSTMWQLAGSFPGLFGSPVNKIFRIELALDAYTWSGSSPVLSDKYTQDEIIIPVFNGQTRCVHWSCYWNDLQFPSTSVKYQYTANSAFAVSPTSYEFSFNTIVSKNGTTSSLAMNNNDAKSAAAGTSYRMYYVLLREIRISQLKY